MSFNRLLRRSRRMDGTHERGAAHPCAHAGSFSLLRPIL